MAESTMLRSRVGGPAGIRSLSTADAPAAAAATAAGSGWTSTNSRTTSSGLSPIACPYANEGSTENPRGPVRHVVPFHRFEQRQLDLGLFGDRDERYVLFFTPPAQSSAERFLHGQTSRGPRNGPPASRAKRHPEPRATVATCAHHFKHGAHLSCGVHHGVDPAAYEPMLSRQGADCGRRPPARTLSSCRRLRKRVWEIYRRRL